MSLNNLKKNLLFSSIETKVLVDALVEDESKSTRKKPSAILEVMILDGFLTQNEQIRFWIVNLYRGFSSGEILSSIFGFNSAGINWKSCGLPLLPFVEYAINEQTYILDYKIDKEPIPHLIECLDSIKRIFTTLKEDNMDIESTIKYTKALETTNYFMDILKNDDEKIQFVTFYRFFKEFWDDLKDSTHTFRALADLTSIQKCWRNDSESRYALITCLRDLAKHYPIK